MESKEILNELFRMREIMGFSSNNQSNTRKNKLKIIKEVRTLLNEGIGDPIDLFKAVAGEKLMDEAAIAEVKVFDKIAAKLEQGLTNLNVTTIDELVQKMSDELGVTSTKLTDEQIISWVKATPEVAKIIDETIDEIASEIFRKRQDDFDLTKVFASLESDVPGAKDIPKIYETLATSKISNNTVTIIEQQIEAAKALVDNLKKLPGKGAEADKVIAGLEDDIAVAEERVAKFRANEAIAPAQKIGTDVDPDFVRPFEDVVDEISDEVAEEVLADPKSRIEEVLNVYLGNRKARQKAGVGKKDVEIISDKIKAKYGNMTVEQLEKNWNTLISDIETTIRKTANELKRQTEEAAKAKGQRRTELLDSIRHNKRLINTLEVLYDNKITRWCIGKNKRTEELEFKGWSVFKCLAFLYIGSEVVVQLYKDPLDRSFGLGIPCGTASFLGLCSTFYTNWGWCESECTEKGGSSNILGRTFDDNLGDEKQGANGRGFIAWAIVNNKPKPYGQDDKGYFYTDNNTKVYMTYKAEHPWFIPVEGTDVEQVSGKYENTEKGFNAWYDIMSQQGKIKKDYSMTGYGWEDGAWFGNTPLTYKSETEGWEIPADGKP